LEVSRTLGGLAMYLGMPAGYGQPVNVEWGVPVLYTRLADGVILPQLFEAETETARKMRSVIQKVGTIRESGKMIGVDAQTLEGSIDVHQTADDVLGTMIGIKLDGNDLDSASVQQDLGNVSGNVTGIQLGGS